MFAYIVRRVLSGVILLVVLSFVTFLLFFAAVPSPGPAKYACGKQCTPAQIDQVKKAFGYDKPIVVQWGEFAKGVFAGREYPEDASLRKAAPNLVSHCPAPCLGYSKIQTMNVTTEIKQDFPISASLAIAAFIMWIIGGVLFGIVAALTKGSIVDRGVVGLSLLFYAFPTFFIGVFALKFISIKWGLLPNPVYHPISDGFFVWAQNLFLPGLTLALVYAASYVRITRAFVLETQSEDYIRTARAKGLRTAPILFKHTMRAALTPLVTMAGLDLAGLMGGAIITESVFNYFGLGKATLVAVQGFDLPTTVGIVLVLATFVVVANIVVDLLYAVIDPRVRVG